MEESSNRLGKKRRRTKEKQRTNAWMNEVKNKVQTKEKKENYKQRQNEQID